MRVGTDGPYVGVAALCKEIRRHPDGTADLVSVVSKVNTNASKLWARDGMLDVQAVVTLWKGRFPGRYDFVLRQVYPDGGAGQRHEWLFQFSDSESATIVQPLKIGLDSLGVHYFECLLDGEILTKIPLWIVAEKPQGWWPRSW